MTSCTETIDIVALSRWLDEALDLDPAAGARWLETLPPDAAHLAPELRALLAPRWAGDTNGLLQCPTAKAHIRWTAGQRVGAFVLHKPLGSGGLAEVWQAAHAANARTAPVALKLPRTDCAAAARSLEREGALHRSLHHPGIVPMMEAGSHAGLPWLAFALCEGQPLHLWQRAKSRRARLGAIQQLATTVAWLHARGVVHRDLKPANVLVDRQGRTRLIDFGIAVALAPAQQPRHDSAPHGFTLGYAAPEQVAGSSGATTDDAYPLGVLLAEAWLEPATVDESHRKLLAEGADHRRPERLAQLLLQQIRPGPVHDLVAQTVHPCARTRPGAAHLARALPPGRVPRWNLGCSPIPTGDAMQRR